MTFAEVFLAFTFAFAGLLAGYGLGREVGWRRGARISWAKYLGGSR